MVMHKGACKEIGFFKSRDHVFIYTIVPFLAYMYVSAKEFIFIEEEYADEIYFIHHGRVSYTLLF